MGARRAGLLIIAVAGAACGPRAVSTAPPAPPGPDVVVAEFERAVLASEAEYAALFDFAKVGVFEKLLHPYDLLGRTPLSPQQRAQYERETAVPYPPERERRNLGLFYPPLAQRTVGSGGCAPVEPRSEYARLLGVPFEPLPAGYEAWEPMRLQVNEMIARGGLVALSCRGGQGQLALVWTRADHARGWDIVTMYDDVE